MAFFKNNICKNCKQNYRAVFSCGKCVNEYCPLCTEEKNRKEQEARNKIISGLKSKTNQFKIDLILDYLIDNTDDFLDFFGKY
jgi:NAD(P)H-nitrite reductase large subunit